MIDAWSGPTPVTNEYPPNEPDGIRKLLAKIDALELQIREKTSNLLGSAGIRLTRLGMFIDSSLTVGGDLATTGNAAFDGHTTIGGVDVVANLVAQVADLASRVTETASISTFSTGSLPNDSTFHSYGASIPITIAVPTGNIVVTVGCGQATIAPDTGAVTAEATFSISGGSVSNGDVSARNYAASPIVLTGASLAIQRAFTVTPGTYTITGQMRAWAAGSAAGAVTFQQPYLTVQVTG